MTEEKKESARQRVAAWRASLSVEERKRRGREAGARFYAANKARVAIDRLVRMYGVDRAQAEEAAAAGRCDICNTPAQVGTGVNGGVVDHCHTTAVVRGFLCGSCNKGLGFFKDNPDTLCAAALYVNRHFDKL